MKTKLILLLMIILAAHISSAACPSDFDSEEDVLAKIKTIINPILSYEGPGEISNIDELLPLVLDLNDAFLTVTDFSEICNVIGERTKITLNETVIKAENISSSIPNPPMNCGAVFSNTCDLLNKPKYCINGSFVDDCNRCGCNPDQTCSSGSCITCSNDLDCGTPSNIPYCSFSDLCTNATFPICINPGTPASSCTVFLNSSCINCPFGCSGSSCNPFICSEMDAGFDPFSQSFLNSSIGARLDTCLNITILLEYSCGVDTILNLIYYNCTWCNATSGIGNCTT